MAPQARSTPHDVLATLVTRLRDLREFVDDVADTIGPEDGDTFLRDQFDEVLSDLGRSLHRLRVSAEALEIDERHAADDDRARAPALEGSAWSIPISEFIGFLSSQRKTGVLWVTSPDELFLVEFRKGKLIRASSDRSPEGQRLGDLLVEQGVLDQDEVEELVSAARSEFRHLGSYLVESGHVTEDQIRLALGAQVQSIFYRLMQSDNAVYRFQEGNELTDAHDLDMNVTHLLLEGARLIDEHDHEAFDFDLSDEEEEEQEYDRSRQSA